MEVIFTDDRHELRINFETMSGYMVEATRLAREIPIIHIGEPTLSVALKFAQSGFTIKTGR